MARKSNVTIKDIAKKLNVSFSTVSKALNNDPLVAEETQNRVKQKAREMGYFPNLMAIGLRSNSTRSIGILLNDLENPTRSHIMKNISIEMAKYGFTSFIFDSAYNKEIERQNIINLLSRIPECVIVSPVTADFNNIDLLSNMYTKTIILSNIRADFPTNYVHFDHIRGGYIAAHTLLSNGHINNLIIMEPLYYPSSDQFYKGVIQAYDEFGISINKNLLIFDFPSIENGMKSVLNLYDFQNKHFLHPFSGVIAFSDLFAIGVYKAAEKIGFMIPGDVSVIGYDDEPIASLVSPKLTTMYYPKEKIAKLCIKILISKLVDNNPSLMQYSLEPELVLRDSINSVF